MGKNPATLFYWDDWAGGTQGMTREEKGAYMELLSAQFSRGTLSIDRIRNIFGHDFERLWNALEEKFNKADDGTFFNPRLRIEMNKRAKYVESRSKNRQKADNEEEKNICKTYDTTYEKHMSPHMGNGNIYSSSSESSDPNTEQSVSIRGGERGDGIVKHQPDEDNKVFAILYANFLNAYGKFGRQEKRGDIEQALRDAMRYCATEISPGASFMDCGTFLVEQARRACAADIANKVERRLSPETWLVKRCYHTFEPIDASPPKRGPTQEEEIQRLIDLQERNSQNGR